MHTILIAAEKRLNNAIKKILSKVDYNTVSCISYNEMSGYLTQNNNDLLTILYIEIPVMPEDFLKENIQFRFIAAISSNNSSILAKILKNGAAGYYFKNFGFEDALPVIIENAGNYAIKSKNRDSAFEITENRENSESFPNMQIVEQHLQFLAEHSNDIIRSTDIDGNLLYISPSIKYFCRFSSDEVKQQSLKGFLTYNSYIYAKRLIKLVKERIRVGKMQPPKHSFIFKHYDRDSAIVWSESLITFTFKEGRFDRIMGV